MKKKIMALILSIGLMFGMIPAQMILAELGGVATYTVVADETVVSPGDTVNFTVKIDLVNPMSAFEFTLDIPNGMSFVSGSQKAVAASEIGFAQVNNNEDYLLVSGYGSTPYEANGSLILATFQCTVNSNAVGTYKVGLKDTVLNDNSYEEERHSVVAAQIVSKIFVTGVTIDETLSLDLGEKKTPSYTVNPSNATNKTVSFTSDNTAVATINQTTGEVTGVTEGTANITVKTEDGSFTDTCVVTVKCLHSNKQEHPAGTSSCTVQADGKYYTCDKCGKMLATDGATVITEVPKLPLASHTTSERALPEYLKTTGDCQNKAVYWKSCSVCNAKLESEGTFEGEFGSHKMSTGLSQENNQHFYECTVSGCTHKDGVEDCFGGTATCQKLAVCTTCGNEYGNLAAHDFATELSKDSTGHWYACQTPNCVEQDGFATHTPNISAPTEDDDQVCAVCSHVIATALGHQCQLHLTPVTANEAKCEVAGNIAYYECTCGKLYKDATALVETDADGVTVKALGHDYTEKLEDTAHFRAEAQNCQEKTSYWYDCSRCEQNAKNDAEATNAWFGTVAGSHNIITTEFGYKVEEGHAHKCEFCDEHDEIIEHVPGEEATETTPQTCTECGYVIKKALGHSFGEEWKSDKDNHWNVCECGEKGNVAAHTDTNKDGKCDTCGHEVPLPPVESNTDKDSPKTGDSNEMILWMALVLLSGLASLVYIDKKRKMTR